MKKKILLNGIVVGEYEATGNVDEDIVGVRTFLKNRGLWKELSSNDAMFAQANSFAEIANSVYSKDLKHSPYKGSAVAPFVVNACFAIEIYLKTILETQGQSSKEHNLDKLFGELDGDSTRIVEVAAQDVRPRYTLPEKSTFRSGLSELSSAFVQWRYLYEHERLSTELQSIRFTMHTLFEAACRAREECAKQCAALTN